MSRHAMVMAVLFVSDEEFACGVGLYLAWRAGWFERRQRLWLGLALVALAAYAWPVLSADPVVEDVVTRLFDATGSAQRLLYWGLPAFAIAAFALSLKPGRDRPARSLARAIGDASYSIYLTHLFVVRIAEEVFERVNVPAWPVALAAFLLSPAVGWLCYQWVEQPLLRAGQRWLARHASPALQPVRQPRLTEARKLADRSL